ncbi:hypothetical protein UlMin_010757 [Ulmus minor]
MKLLLVELGTMFLKSLSQPIANRLKQTASKQPRFRQCIINIARKNHTLTTCMQKLIYGNATAVEIRPLNEEKAVEAAADLFGEVFLFSFILLDNSKIYIIFVIGWSRCLVFEIQRSERAEARKMEQWEQEIEIMKQRNETLSREMELERLKQRIEDIEQFAKCEKITK